MSKAHLTALISALVFLRWLDTGHVALTVGGLTATVPALAVAAVAVATVTAAVVWLVVPDPGRAGHARRLASADGGHVMTAAAIFAAVSAAYAARNWAGDYWVQTHRQACAKGAPGWPGRRACAAHVATYTLTLAECLALAWWRLALPLNPAWTTAGLAVSAVTHYAADRRWPLRALTGRVGKLRFQDLGDGLATGAAYLDQAWHWWWLFAAALITAGGIHA